MYQLLSVSTTKIHSAVMLEFQILIIELSVRSYSKYNLRLANAFLVVIITKLHYLALRVKIFWVSEIRITHLDTLRRIWMEEALRIIPQTLKSSKPLTIVIKLFILSKYVSIIFLITEKEPLNDSLFARCLFSLSEWELHLF